MMTDKKQCETCAWPLECSSDMKAQKPEGADCPREAGVWDRRLGDTSIMVSEGTALDELVDGEPRVKDLALV